MKIVMTLMVRDEADVVGAMLEHHRAQGVDHVIITDNGSIDGTADVLRRYEEAGFATVWHDPVHRKQQYQTVTRMARHAATAMGADWVINADADEFWIPTTGTSLREVLADVSADVPYLTVPVVNLTGRPAKDGTGLDRLVYRDLRTSVELRAVGIPFPPTADAVHRGHPLVEIAQGNHFVSAPGWPAEGGAAPLEVLHLPWRSWRQYEHKVRIAGQAYLSNPDLTPSPRHHGMQDFRRWEDGRLEHVYVAKHPTRTELEALVESGSLVVDDRLAGLQSLNIEGARSDVLYSRAEEQTLSETGRLLAALEATADERYLALRSELENAITERDAARRQLREVREERDRLATALEIERGRFVVRTTERAAAAARRILHPRRSTSGGRHSG